MDSEIGPERPFYGLNVHFSLIREKTMGLYISHNILKMDGCVHSINLDVCLFQDKLWKPNCFEIGFEPSNIQDVAAFLYTTRP